NSYSSFISFYPANRLVPEAEYGRAWAYDKLGRAKEAKEAFKGLAAKYPDGAHAPDAWYKVGEYSYKEKDYPEVAAAFEKYLALRPDSKLKADADYQLGVAREALGQDEAAAQAFIAASGAGGPLKAPSALRAGRLLAKLGKGAEALPYFDTAAGDPDFASEALVGKGRALLQANKYDEAVVALKKASEHTATAETRAEGYYLAGEASVALRDYKGAVLEYTKSTVVGDTKFKPLSLMGIAGAYEKLGENEKALGAYKKFLDAYQSDEKASEAQAAIKRLEGKGL
ncbi:MAG TPA: tetratricopeptide repeat protein, partial [Nitrospirota bacterium]|nr:tetratricopeptide repeat protein [Nitrospirota bacterium]